MAQDARAPRALALADDYDTALHIVESIRRKALTARRAQRASESDSNSDERNDDSDNTDDEAQRQMGSDSNDEDEGDSGNNNARGRFRRSSAASLRVQCSAPETHIASPLKPTRSPTRFRSASSSNNSSRPVDALRIESLVELHRIPSGRNLRLKHISQSSKEALSPLALTPRAPSGKRPAERPSSWSSSSSRQSAAVAAFHQSPQLPHRSASTGSHASTMPTNAITPLAMEDDELREMRTLPPSLLRPATRTASSSQQSSLRGSGLSAVPVAGVLPASKTKTNQERRCSFTISELALKEMGFARSTPTVSGLSMTPPNSDNNNNNSSEQQLSDALARLQSPSSGEPQVESEEKVVYKFALWKNAGKRKQLPDAISTRQHETQQHQQSAGDSTAIEVLTTSQQAPAPTLAAALSPLQPIRSGSESPSLRLTPSRSPTISTARSSSSRTFPPAAPPAKATAWPYPH